MSFRTLIAWSPRRPVLPFLRHPALGQRTMASIAPTASKASRYYGASFTGGPDVHAFLEEKTSTWQYLVTDPSTKKAILIDPVLDYDAPSGSVKTDSADKILSFVRDKGIDIVRILETHAHADHLTSSQYLKTKLGGNVPICIGSRITQVQDKFAPIYGIDPKYLIKTFDVYLRDDETLKFGNMECKAMHLPGHTPDHLGYQAGKSVFTGDSIFMPDVGTARADFPGGDAKALFQSLRRLLMLPSDYKLFVGHDYPPEHRTFDCVTTVADQNEQNKHVKVGTNEDTFIRLREERDRVLAAPRLLHPSLQVNVRAGHLPPFDEHGLRYLRTPVRLEADEF